MTKKHSTQKLFIIRKYVKANSAAEALRMDALTPAQDVFVVSSPDEQAPVGFVEKE